MKQYVITVVSKRIIDEFAKNLSSNVLVFRKNLDRVRDLIFTGVNAKAGEYGNIGTTLFAASIEGERRALQEDTVMLLVHPKIPDFKLLLVADGLSENGADKPKWEMLQVKWLPE